MMKPKNIFLFFALLLFVVILATAIRNYAIDRLAGNAGADTEVTEPQNTVVYNNTTLPVEDDVAVNGYDESCFSTDESGFVHYDSETVKHATGIDVSSHQGEIDWQAVADAGVEFAIIRGGYRGYSTGAVKEDDAFQTNIQGALNAGLAVGAYFYSQAVTAGEAMEEAEFLLALLADYQVSGPIVFDWEEITYDDARTDGLSSTLLTQCAAAFCDTIANAGYEPMVYFYREIAYLQYCLADLTDYGFWLAEYDETPSFYYNFKLWQYSCTGSVPGISGGVDLDLMFLPRQ